MEVSPAGAPTPGSAVPESLVIVTGLSGSGKSYVNKCLEDMGYVCVDNLPLELVEPLLGQISAKRVGIILDVRNPDFAARFPEILGRLRRRVPGTRLLFLDASEESLIRRFSETRRPHPLSGKVSLLEALRRERAMLEEVRSVADVVVDTSAMTVHELRSFMQKTFVGDPESAGMIVSATSFGYKFGIPHDVDLLFDVRFLANPHFVPELKGKTGMDPAVAAYIEKDPETRPF
ncbi:MAG TPA: RNase adapter RapZ, partial [Thermoanaerobaculia bacterium]